MTRWNATRPRDRPVGSAPLPEHAPAPAWTDDGGGRDREIQAEIASASAIIDAWEQSAERTAPLTEEAVRLATAESWRDRRALREGDPTEQAELYKALGLSLTDEKEAATGEERVLARLQLSGGGGGI